MKFQFLPNTHIDLMMIEYPRGTRVQWVNTSPPLRDDTGRIYVVDRYEPCQSNCSVCGGGKRLLVISTGAKVCKSWIPEGRNVSGYYKEVK